MKSRILFLLTLLCASFMPTALAGHLGFALMEDGDRIEITEHSTGCFHNSVSYYEVKKIDGSYHFREYAITWAKDNSRRIAEKRVLGQKKLTAKEVAGLDELLKFYRGNKEVGSTSQVSLLVEYFEPKGRVKAERLKDHSGGYGIEKRKGLLTFYQITRSIKKAKAGKDSEAPAPQPSHP